MNNVHDYEVDADDNDSDDFKHDYKSTLTMKRMTEMTMTMVTMMTTM